MWFAAFANIMAGILILMVESLQAFHSIERRQARELRFLRIQVEQQLTTKLSLPTLVARLCMITVIIILHPFSIFQYNSKCSWPNYRESSPGLKMLDYPHCLFLTGIFEMGVAKPITQVLPGPATPVGLLSTMVVIGHMWLFTLQLI